MGNSTFYNDNIYTSLGDYLEISEGSSTQRYAGTSTPAPLTTIETITVKLHLVDYDVSGTGFLATVCCSVSITTGEWTLNNKNKTLTLLASSPTCLHQSAPDGYFRNEDCRQMNLFVCEVNKNVAFIQPPQGKSVHNIYCTTYLNKHLEQYIMSPNYPDPYPNNYEEVI